MATAVEYSLHTHHKVSLLPPKVFEHLLSSTKTCGRCLSPLTTPLPAIGIPLCHLLCGPSALSVNSIPNVVGPPIAAALAT